MCQGWWKTCGVTSQAFWWILAIFWKKGNVTLLHLIEAISQNPFWTQSRPDIMHWQILLCHLKSLPFSKPTSLAFMKHYILFQKVTLLRFKKFHLIIQNVDEYIFEAIISLYSPVTSSTSLYYNYLRQFLIFWWNFLKIYAEKSAL